MIKFKDKNGFTFTAEKGSVLYTILEADNNYEEVKEVKTNAKSGDVKKSQAKTRDKK